MSRKPHHSEVSTSQGTANALPERFSFGSDGTLWRQHTKLLSTIGTSHECSSICSILSLIKKFWPSARAISLLVLWVHFEKEVRARAMKSNACSILVIQTTDDWDSVCLWACDWIISCSIWFFWDSNSDFDISSSRRHSNNWFFFLFKLDILVSRASKRPWNESVSSWKCWRTILIHHSLNSGRIWTEASILSICSSSSHERRDLPTCEHFGPLPEHL